MAGAAERDERGAAWAAFLDAVRRPLDFLADASAATAARTRLPGAQLARRGRALAAGLREKDARDALEELCAALEAYGAQGQAERRSLVERCRSLVARLASAAAPGSPPPLPPYRRSGGDVDAALAELAGPVQFVRGVGPRRAAELGKFGIQTLEDLLYHLPFRYEDRRRVSTIADAVVGEEAGFSGEIVHLTERIVGRARRRILEAVLRDATGLLGLTWYHQVSYFRDRFKRGQQCFVYGRVERDPGGSKRIVHPDVDLTPQTSSGGVLPVYNKPTTMTVGAMRKLVRQAVGDFAKRVPSVLPAELTEGVADLATALRAVHQPEPDADVDALNDYHSAAHRALVFDELFFLQLGLCLRRRHNARDAGFAMSSDGRAAARLTKLLPFALTGAQRRVLDEIRADMARPHPMHRLVQGDVGSGKTMVGLFAALVAIENGRQAAFMAPTELLAEQHHRTIETYARQLGIRCELVVGEGGRAKRAALQADLASGAIHIAVGTHALIQESVEMPHLGLGIIDEQHRFGVLQRAALRRLGAAGGQAPDILLMTATPIPRTLAMTVYGDLDVSVLDERPAGRQPVRTMLFNEAERARVYRLVKEQLDRGRQGYVVYPLVEASERSELLDATTMARELGRTVFADYRVGLVHGRMKADEKEAVMKRFRAGDLQLLVSTTVIEVGVDVANATVMVVEHAERFGLSQLHQLRGRVGRGSERAFCILVAPHRDGGVTARRLQVLRQSNDGFRIAEADLDLRGPGEFLGTRQSGLPDFRVSNLVRDTRLLVEARQAAERWLARDPDLSSPESAAVLRVLKHRWAGRLGLAEIG